MVYFNLKFGVAMNNNLELENEDLAKIKNLMKELDLKYKANVIKHALSQVEREIKENKWKEAAKRASKSSMRVNAEFRDARD
jgi:hypothetical protein